MTKQSQTGESKDCFWGASTMQGWSKTHTDAFVCRKLNEQVTLFGVFDGHNGGEVATFVKDHIADYILKEASFADEEYEEALENAFVALDAYMLTSEGQEKLQALRKDQDTPLDLCGSSACVVLLTPKEVFCASVGSSTAIISQNTAEFEKMSEPQLPEDATEKKRIEAAGGTIEMDKINGKLVMARGFGDFAYKRNAEK